MTKNNINAAICIGEEDANIRLDRWFKRHYPAVPQGLLQKLLRKGHIRLDGKKAQASTRIETGQELTFPPSLAEGEPTTSPRKKAEPQTLSDTDRKALHAMVLYDEDGVIILNKPAGLAVQGGSGITRSVDGMLDALVDQKGQRPKLVHRLDKDTSGILVLARTAKMAAQLTEAFRDQEAEKTYWALVVGVPSHTKGEINLPLAKQTKGANSRTIAAETIALKEKVGVDKEGGKKAITRYQILDQAGKRVALVALYPLTGRTHQLRVHMLAIGHPVLGDGKYGGADAFVDGLDIPKQLHLHARHIRLALPGGRVVEQTAELPRHMQHTITELGLEAHG